MLLLAEKGDTNFQDFGISLEIYTIYKSPAQQYKLNPFYNIWKMLKCFTALASPTDSLSTEKLLLESAFSGILRSTSGVWQKLWSMGDVSSSFSTGLSLFLTSFVGFVAPSESKASTADISNLFLNRFPLVCRGFGAFRFRRNRSICKYMKLIMKTFFLNLIFTNVG